MKYIKNYVNKVENKTYSLRWQNLQCTENVW